MAKAKVQKKKSDWFTLVPSLVLVVVAIILFQPQELAGQAVVGGVAAAVGYGIGFVLKKIFKK